MSANPDRDDAVVEPDPGWAGGSVKQPDQVHADQVHADSVVEPDPDMTGGAVKQPDPDVTGG